MYEQVRSRHASCYRLEQVPSSEDDKAMHVDRVAVDNVTVAQPSIGAFLIESVHEQETQFIESHEDGKS